MSDSYRLSEKEFAAIVQLDGRKRYEHFVSRVADWQKIWSLRSESGWVSISDNIGNAGFPVWPHPDYAAACATDDWEGNLPTSIDVYEFTESWLPNMEIEKVNVAVFPTPKLKGVMVPATQLQSDLREELEQYE